MAGRSCTEVMISEETRGGVEQLDGDSCVSTDELQVKAMEEETLMLKVEVLLLDKEVILGELISLGLNPEDNIEEELTSFKTLPVEQVEHLETHNQTVIAWQGIWVIDM